jgi:glycerate-2-kinase
MQLLGLIRRRWVLLVALSKVPGCQPVVIASPPHHTSATATAAAAAAARSEALQNLPPAIFTLVKSTEPWSDEYYSFDLEAALRQAGFDCVESTQPDHRHRTVFGITA